MKVSLGSSVSAMAVRWRLSPLEGELRPSFFLPDRHLPETGMQLCIALGREIQQL